MTLIAFHRGRFVPMAPPAHAIETVRELADMPEDLARRVRAARGMEPEGSGPAHGDVGSVR